MSQDQTPSLSLPTLVGGNWRFQWRLTVLVLGLGSLPVGAAEPIATRSPAALAEVPGGDATLADWLARTIRPQVRAWDAHIAELTHELAGLPRPVGVVNSARIGWHTNLIYAPDRPIWVQVDLGKVWPVGVIALVPARSVTEAGYGFPLRFRVEVSLGPDFQRAEIVADLTAEDFPNPGVLPVAVNAAGRPARFVRVTVVKTQTGHDDGMAALGELIVLSGPRNVAAGRSVQASSSHRSVPAWHARNLTDGLSVLGPPVAPEPSPSDGYLAQKEDNADLAKWVQVDLGRTLPVDEVRLFPARPMDLADRPGHGFPVRFLVAVANDAEFRTPRILFDARESDFDNPADFPVACAGTGMTARYVRVTATKLYDRVQRPSFALAELQVWSGSANVAFGAPVTALDQSDNGQPRWHPAALVDGCNSRNRLLDYQAWLTGLSRSREIALELARVGAQRREAVHTVGVWFGRATVAGGSLLVVAGVALGIRARRSRRRAVEELRRRIASDLHDEIGSNLGSIALLSEAARRQSGDRAAREDLLEIGRIAGQTNEALREIVWLLNSGAVTRTELIARMRESVHALLGDTPAEFEVPETLREGACHLEFTRNVWLIFKEVLHNIAKHAGATAVRIRVAEPAGGFELEIVDDGRGFRADAVEPGHGLANLRRRAEQLGATLRVASEPGRGTAVTLTMPKP
jgi:signal transduction histidine kinase